MSQKANRLPTARDRLLKNKKEIKELYGLSRQRITQRTIQPPSGGTGSPRGDTAPSGNFLKTEGDRMIGPIAFDPVLVSIVNNPAMNDDDSINISRNTGDNPPDYSSYVLVTPNGVDDDLKTIFGAAFNGQLLYLQGTATTIIRLQNGDASNGGNIVTPDGSEFAISGAKIVTLIFDPTISPSIGVQGAWRIMDNRGSAISDVFHATADANYPPVTGEHVEFNESVDGVATGIAVSTGVAQAQGIFSNLLAGRSYLLEAGLEVEFDGNTGDLEYQWFDVTGATLIGTKGIAWNIRDSTQVGSQPIAQAIFTPSVDSQVEVRITGDVNADAVLLASSPNTKSSFARITELGGGGAGAGGGGAGINFPILYPIDAIGTAPVSPSTTDIDLAATTAHVHTLDTVGDVTINFQNPPAGTLNITGELIIETNGSGSIVTFSQTTQPTSSFTLDPNSRNIITFQSSDGGSTYDVFQAGQAGGGGGATALNDLTDVNLAGVSINDIFQFNGVFWINKQSFNFGAGPFGMSGALRYTNDNILLSARNLGNSGDLELKATSGGALDWTDTDNNVVSIQARTQNAIDPDNRLTMSVGSGAAADALLDTNVETLRFGVSGVLPMDLDNASQSLQLTDYSFSILDSFSGKLFNVANLGGTLGTELRAVDSFKFLLSGVEKVRYDDAAGQTIQFDFALNLFDTFTGKAFAQANLGGILGAEVRAVDRYRLLLSGVTILDIEDAGDNFIINDFQFHIFDTGSSQDFSIANLGTGLGTTIQAVEFLKFSLGFGVNHMQLRNTGGTTDLRLQNPSSNSDPVIFRMLANNAVDPRNDMFFSMQSGALGKFLIFTETDEMELIVDGAVTGAITPNLTLSRLGSINALALRQNTLNNLDFNFISIPTGAMTAGRIGATNYVSKNAVSTVISYARTQGRAENVTVGNEDGRYDIDVSLNGTLNQLASFGNTTNIFSGLNDINIISADDMLILAGGSFLNLGAGGGGTEVQIQLGVLALNSGTNLLMTGVGANGFIQQEEITDPAAPAANNARIYTRDNGAGKTQLVVRFPTGAIQVIATEP